MVHGIGYADFVIRGLFEGIRYSLAGVAVVAFAYEGHRSFKIAFVPRKDRRTFESPQWCLTGPHAISNFPWVDRKGEFRLAL